MRIIFTILFFVCIGNVYSQTEFIIKSKTKENEILLRWTPVKSDLFKLAIKNGFTLYRKEWNGSTNPPESFWKSELDFTQVILAKDKSDTAWANNFKRNSDVGILYSYCYPETVLSKIEEENFFGLALLTCDLNPELSKLAGLFFRDDSIQKGKNYAYKIEINTVKISNIILVKTEPITQLPLIENFDLKSSQKSVEISWNFKLNQLFYSGYFIERSEDSLNFKKINDRGIIPMSSQYEKNKEVTFYTDTNVREGKRYWYRLSGRDHFGETGENSKWKSVFVAPVFKGELIIDTLFEKQNNVAILHWSFTNANDVQITDKISVYRSKSINGNYELLKELNKNDSQLEIELLQRENYLKIVAQNSGGKIESWPYLLLIPDRIPPVAPDSLIGIIDKNGKVNLNWKRNSESDLMGYRVFRTNILHEEMVEVSKTIIAKTIFEDSVDINSLTEEIYFAVNAVDSTYNNSKLSAPIKLQKPDYIPPVVAPIINFLPNENGNLVRWNLSTSRDVAKTELRRSLDGKIYETLFSTSDTIHSFVDSTIQLETGYYYKTIVYDDANNFTESESIYIFNSKFKIQVNDSVNVKVDREKKFILLTWVPLKQEVYSYTIYKAKKGDALRSFKTVNGNIFELKDTELYISNEYIYAIKAVLKSGREVMVAKEVRVEY